MIKNINGKNVNIPDEAIENYMKSLELSKEEAIELWLDDNDYTENEEQEELDKKAKSVKIKHEAKAATAKERKPREKKANPDKKMIIQAIFDGLSSKIDNISIRNDEKYLDFVYNDVEYTLNLVAHRKKK